MKELKKFLLFKIGAIGDVLMTAPLIRQLRKNFPNSKIDYLVGKTASEIIKYNKNVDKILIFDEDTFFKKKIIKFVKLIKLIRNNQYDAVFVLDKHYMFNIAAFLFGIKKRIGFDRLGKEGILLTNKVYYGKIRHEIYYYLDLLQSINVKVNYKDHKMDLFLGKSDEDFAKTFFIKNKLIGKKTIAICPGGGNNPGQVLEEKIMPVERYIQLIKKINYPVILIGGKTDKIKEEKIIKECPNTISVIGKTTINQSAALMKRCYKIICNDSGPMHIASTVNKNIISIFGPVNPKRKGPLWKESKKIWKAQKIYNANNETFGTYKKMDYFSNLDINDILKFL